MRRTRIELVPNAWKAFMLTTTPTPLLDLGDTSCCIGQIFLFITCQSISFYFRYHRRLHAVAELRSTNMCAEHLQLVEDIKCYKQKAGIDCLNYDWTHVFYRSMIYKAVKLSWKTKAAVTQYCLMYIGRLLHTTSKHPVLLDAHGPTHVSKVTHACSRLTNSLQI